MSTINYITLLKHWRKYRTRGRRAGSATNGCFSWS